MKVLVAYATNSSGTLVASNLVTDILKQKNHEVIQRDIRQVKPESLQNFDLIIFGSPSWNYNKMEGQPHEFFSSFFEKSEGQQFPHKQFAIFGLGDTAYMYFCGAVDHIEAFVKKINGQLKIPSLRIDGFFFNQKANEDRLSEWTQSLIANE